ncbi:MAG: hypothetical protein V3S68_06330 [Dehalococcoidia bacterium]
MRRRQEQDAGVVGGVSDWDGNGLAAALSHTADRNLLAPMESETAMLYGMVDDFTAGRMGPCWPGCTGWWEGADTSTVP